MNQQSHQHLLEFLNLPQELISQPQVDDLEIWLNAKFDDSNDINNPKPQQLTQITDNNTSDNKIITKNSAVSTDPTDKRRRNTEASARFRAKKKIRDAELKNSQKELELKVSFLEKKTLEQEKEIKWLRSLITEKQGIIGLSGVFTPGTEYNSFTENSTPAFF
ncbi:hypothetical protein HK099_004048 [Clydaea vesicula]|uniref:BZIP domain-containing protein n=1 Tax=Clydaea vesicula TaxID=447962 RepID=A0AAD5U154_9FUNG|nr:hypothetical protein HK099_004048 [Clydaea vesicula]KAJ3394532.1 hypothetical protein HDU92_006808 [Lobulomyces angularis]